MRTIITWVVLVLIAAFGVFECCQPAMWATSLFDVIGKMGLIFVVLITPIWMSGSCWIVKMAIDNAQKNNYRLVCFYLFSRGWLIFPLPKYAEIVRILRHLCKDRKTKPEGMSPEYSQYIVKDDFGSYVLNWEGKDKMLKKVNTGWFTGEFFESPKYGKLVMRIVVVVALIRLVISIVNIFVHH